MLFASGSLESSGSVSLRSVALRCGFNLETNFGANAGVLSGRRKEISACPLMKEDCIFIGILEGRFGGNGLQ